MNAPKQALTLTVTVALALWSAAALGADAGPAPEKVTNGGLPALLREPDASKLAGGPKGEAASSIAEFAALPFEREAYWGEAQLGLKPAVISSVRAGLEKLYLRDYQGARTHFGKVEAENPAETKGVAAVSDLLVWQALMLENFDFAYDKQYWTASAKARQDLDAALATPGNDGFERFLYTGVSGVEAIHTMRTSQYLQALKLAFEAMDHLQKAREAAPGFTDLMLADGMYNYWRAVITMTTKSLPDFGDSRVEGIEQMQVVEREGVFLSAPASLSLAFTWLEEERLKEALTTVNRNRQAYPDNVVNNLMAGTTLLYMKKTDSALEAFDAVLKVAPDNKRAVYWRGRALMQAGNSAEALKAFEKYLSFTGLEDYQRSMAQYRIGQIYFRDKDRDKAEAAWKEAVKIDGNKGAKDRLEDMKKKK